jgi:thiamine-monophosphate kinase
MRRLMDVGEFGLIDRVERLARGLRAPQVVVGIGDDAAVLRPRAGEDLVVSADALVEGVHFRWETQTPRAIGGKALAVNLSDLAAMGARPLGCIAALAAPPDLALSRVDGCLRGLLAVAVASGCPLVGGNVARARETSWTLTAIGAVARGRALRRGRARAGDRIFVTGSLGGPALALARAERGLARIRRPPTARLEAGRALARMRGRVSCIDISDGFVSDLGHLLEGTGLGAEIEAERLPRPRGFARSCAELHLDPARLAATGGEDYELLFTLAPGAPKAEALTRRLGVPVTEVGRVTRRPGLRGLGPEGGWTHF